MSRQGGALPMKCNLGAETGLWVSKIIIFAIPRSLAVYEKWVESIPISKDDFFKENDAWYLYD